METEKRNTLMPALVNNPKIGHKVTVQHIEYSLFIVKIKL